MKKLLSLTLATFLAFSGIAEAALTFTGAGTTRVEDVDGGAASSLTAFTIVAWVKASALAVDRAIYSCPDDGTTAICSYRMNDTSGNMRLFLVQTTTAADFRSNNNGITTGTWFFEVATYDEAATPRIHLYNGTFTASVTEHTYSLQTNGVGTKAAEAGSVGGVWGNRKLPGSYASGFAGDIAVGMLYSRVLTLGEIRSLQFKPAKLSGCVAFHYFGFNGTGTQTDYSGNGTSGTVTGSTQAANVPLGPSFATGD